MTRTVYNQEVQNLHQLKSPLSDLTLQNFQKLYFIKFKRVFTESELIKNIIHLQKAIGPLVVLIQLEKVGIKVFF